MFRKAALALLCSGFLPQVWAIQPAGPVSQYIRDRWGPEKGFPRGPVYSITQTADGYLWIGAAAGLVRFDGVNFHLPRNESGRVSVGSVLGLMTDNESNLWLRVAGPRLIRFRDNVFEADFPGPMFSNVTAMGRSRTGDLLAAAPDGGAIIRRNSTFSVVAESSATARSPVMAIAQTADGAIWMGTRDAGLFRVMDSRTEAIKGLPDPKVNCLLADGNELWIGADDGIVHWDGSRLTRPAHALAGLQVLAIMKDRDGNLWVGANDRGLLRVNSSGVAQLDSGAGAVTAIFEDREGNVWFGGADGLERLRDSAFVTFTPNEGMPAEDNGPVFVDSRNDVWFAPLHGGLYRMQKGRPQAIVAAGLGSDVVYSISGRGEEVWLGRRRGGLTRLGPGGPRTYTRADGLAQNSVFAVHHARDGSVWAGTLNGGVSRLRDGKFTTYTTAHGLASNMVVSIAEGLDGEIWLASPNGLTSFIDGSLRTYRLEDGLPSAAIESLSVDSDGVLWIGSASGLAFRRGDGFQRVEAPLILRQKIQGLTQDRAGALWIVTSRGVVRAERSKLLSGRVTESDLREYGAADGLQTMEGVKRHQTVVTDGAGRIWMSMRGGLSMVDPGRASQPHAPPLAHIESIETDGRVLDLRDAARISVLPHRIVFRYAGISLAVPERVRYRVRLDGFDRDWSSAGTAREAVYTNLSPGAYRFRLMASSPDGAWNGPEASFRFEIEPRFWQQWWFRIGALFVFVLGVVGIYRYRMHELTRQLNVRFEERLAERTRIAQELHDTLLQGFLSASMQLHVASERVPENSPAKPALDRVLQLMGQVIEEGRNAVRGLRSAESTPLDLQGAFCQVREELAVDDSVEFRVIIEGQVRPLHPILRDEIYRIGREAISNAFRHSGASLIEVQIDFGVRQFRLLVRDNGCGIDPNVLKSGREGHWGLPGMRERAESIGAQLHVWSKAGLGSEVVLSIPAHVAFPSKSKPDVWRKMRARLYPRSVSND